jgi:hypothetical protein
MNLWVEARRMMSWRKDHDEQDLTTRVAVDARFALLEQQVADLQHKVDVLESQFHPRPSRQPLRGRPSGAK